MISIILNLNLMRLFFLMLAISSLVTHAQVSNSRIDSLFAEWNKPMVPGVSIGVVQNGNLLYQRSFGLSNLSKGIPIDSLTEFWIASVTKQFTAFGIYLLESNGKVKLKNSVRRYIPELPLVFEPVTIDQLIHHTSGIRDGFVLTALSKKLEATGRLSLSSSVGSIARTRRKTLSAACSAGARL